MLLKKIMRNQAQYHNMENNHNILIIDNHQVARLGLIRLINQDKDLKICAEATGLTQALYAIAVRKVLNGQLYISDTIATRILLNWSSRNSLKNHLDFY